MSEGGPDFCNCACISGAGTPSLLEACQRGCRFGAFYAYASNFDSTETAPPFAATSPTAVTMEMTSLPPATADDSVATGIDTTPASSLDPSRSLDSMVPCVDREDDVMMFMTRLIGQELGCAALAELGSCRPEAGLPEVRHLCPASCGLCTRNSSQRQPPVPSPLPPNDPATRVTHSAPSSTRLFWGMGAVFFTLLVCAVILAALRRRRQHDSWAPGMSHRRVGVSALPALAQDDFDRDQVARLVLRQSGRAFAYNDGERVLCDPHSEPSIMLTRMRITLPPVRPQDELCAAPPMSLTSPATTTPSPSVTGEAAVAASGASPFGTDGIDELPPSSPIRCWLPQAGDRLCTLQDESSL